ncbi:MAG: L(+)-tartrate dehydratase subunit beta [Treponema sp.]|nr:L(+)-tartrate dehydratase subunit beta [Treponema sp.]
MEKIIKLPCNNDDLHGLKIGDVFYLCGLLVTGRDEVHRRVTDEKEGMALPMDLNGMAIYHAGPIVRELPRNGSPGSDVNYELISIGPTSSIRMEKWAAGFIEKTGVKVMIGKGGMGEKTAAACKKFGAVHCVYPGGCAVSGADQIEKIESVFWKELGMAECLWSMKTNMFGPLIVSIDTEGNNLFADNTAYYESRKSAAINAVLTHL